MYPEEVAVAGLQEDARMIGARTAAEAVPADPPDFDALFERYHAMVYQLACRILGDREEALDVAQEVFLTVFRKIDRFRGDSSLKTWIYRIAVNRASNRGRWWNRLRRRGSVSLEERPGGDGRPSYGELLRDGGRTQEELVLLREERAQIERSLLELPLQQRVAVVLRDIEGMSYEEIAASLRISLGTVKSRIARGREELKRRLNGVLDRGAAREAL